MMPGKTQNADLRLFSFTPQTLIMAAINLPQQSLVALPLWDFSVVTRVTMM